MPSSNLSSPPPSILQSQPSPEQRFRELFEQAPVSIQIFAPDGRTLRVNKAWEALWQIHEGSDLMAYVFSEYNILQDPQLVANGVAGYLARAVAGESLAIPENRYDVGMLGGNPRVRWVTARVHPIKDAAGAILEVMLMHEDITERVEAENALRIREERFRSLVMASSQMIWTTTADGRVLDDSPSWRALTGQSYDEWKEFGWLDVLHPDDRQPTLQLWTACVAARAVFETEYRIRRTDGQYRWTAVKGVPIQDANGQLREWIGANADIHDAVMAREGLARRLAREQRNSALLAKVAQASRTLSMVLSKEDIGAALAVEVKDILEVGHAAVVLDEDEGGACAEDKAEGCLSVPLVDRKGKNIGLIRAWGKAEGEFTGEDEAILVQLASIAANGFENARLYSSLREQDRRKDEFLAMLAHELRNPLAPIAAAAELLKFGSAGEERVRRASEVIGRQVRHMTSLVDDLLDVSRVTRGLIRLERTRVPVAEVLASAVEQARPAIEARGHAFAIEQEVDAGLVLGDPNRLVQVLVNLLNNAAKYTPRGGCIALAVTRQGTKGEMVAIAVRDNGIGIDGQLLPHVFDLFTQAERTPDRAQGGLGIGLALVRNIVTLHGGKVLAHSAGPGRGSVFTVVLETLDAD